MEYLPLPSAALNGSLPWVGVWLCLASAVTWALIRLDRRRAERGQYRLPEANLLWLAVFGGWPGALVALRQCRGLRFSDTFRGWLRGIVAAELLFLGLASVPQGGLVVVTEGALSMVVGEVTATERNALPRRIVLESSRQGSDLGQIGASRLVTLSARP
ncbi:MAG: DUF1294 domain-containing protein [Gemmobacter sp.]